MDTPDRIATHDVDDVELVVRARGGDMEAYGMLIARHQTAALRVAASITGSTDEAKDIVQDAFIRLHRGLSSWRGTGTVRAWILRSVANEAKNHLRSRARRRRRDERHRQLDLRVDATTEDLHDGQSTRRELAEAFANLTAPDREVLGCRFIADLSEAETAAVLGTPTGTVKSRTSRALDRLRKVMDHD